MTHFLTSVIINAGEVKNRNSVDGDARGLPGLLDWLAAVTFRSDTLKKKTSRERRSPLQESLVIDSRRCVYCMLLFREGGSLSMFNMVVCGVGCCSMVFHGGLDLFKRF